MAANKSDVKKTINQSGASPSGNGSDPKGSQEGKNLSAQELNKKYKMPMRLREGTLLELAQNLAKAYESQKSEIDEMRKERESSKQFGEQQQEAISALDAKVNKLQAELDETRNNSLKNADAMRAQNDKNDTIHSLDAKLKFELERIKKESADKNSSNEARIQQLEKDLSNAKDKAARKDLENQSALADMAQKHEGEKTELNSKVKELTATVANKHAEISAKQTEVAGLHSELSTTKETAAKKEEAHRKTLEETTKKHTTEKASLNSQVDSLQSDIAKKRDEISSKQDSIAQLQSELATTKEAAAKKEEEHGETLRNTKAENTKAITKLNTDIGDLKDTVKAKNTDIASKEKRITELTAQSDSDKSEIANLKHTVAESNESIAQGQAAAETQDIELNQLKTAIQTLKKQLMDLQKLSINNLAAKTAEIEKSLAAEKELQELRAFKLQHTSNGQDKMIAELEKMVGGSSNAKGPADAGAAAGGSAAIVSGTSATHKQPPLASAVPSQVKASAMGMPEPATASPTATAAGTHDSAKPVAFQAPTAINGGAGNGKTQPNPHSSIRPASSPSTSAKPGNQPSFLPQFGRGQTDSKNGSPKKPFTGKAATGSPGHSQTGSAGRRAK